MDKSYLVYSAMKDQQTCWFVRIQYIENDHLVHTETKEFPLKSSALMFILSQKEEN